MPTATSRTANTTALRPAPREPRPDLANVVNELGDRPVGPYGPAPVSPTDDPNITSLAPNTAVATSVPLIWVTITGPSSRLVEPTGGVTPYYAPSRRPASTCCKTRAGVPGIAVVKVIDHG